MASSIESTFENILIRHDDSGLDSEKTVIRQGDLLELSAAAQASVGSNPSLEPASPTDSLLGKQLDHFLIESLIGTGGMGAVFRGRDLRLDRIVAIKVVPIADRGAEAMRRFRFEAQSAAKLDHPHIARVYYVGETELWSYIVFEFVEGTNLRELVVRQGPLSIDDAVGLTRQVAEALQHAFERKVVHRDIKPSNILVTQVGQAKLVDMGLARNTELEKSTNDLTASGVTLGTFDYISPEQAHDPRNADVRSDIYSLGCTLYFLITGHPPFPDGTALQKLLLHGTKLPDDPRYFRSDISDSLISILRKMMAKKPADRYQEPGDLIHDLRTLAELEGLDWAQVSDSVIKLPNASQRTWLEASLPLLISLAAIAGIGFWQWLHSISYQNAVFTIPREEIPELVAVAMKPEANSGSSQSKQYAMNSQSTGQPGTSAEFGPMSITGKTETKAIGETNIQGDTILVNPNAFHEKERSANVVRTIEQAIELANNLPHIKRIVVRGPAITTSMTGLRSSLDIETDIVIQSESGGRCKWTIDGADSQVDAVDAAACIDCLQGNFVLQDIDVEWRVAGLARRKALFAVHPGAWLQIRNCNITAHDNGSAYVLGPYSTASKRPSSFSSIVAVLETPQDKSDEITTSTTANTATSNSERALKPTRISASQFSIRGQCDWLQLTSPIRTEVQLENGWLAISGSMLETFGSRSVAKSSVPLRIDMQAITTYTMRPWMTCSVSNTHPYPLPIVRTAKACIFSGSSTLIEWNATDCPDWRVWEQTDQGQKLTKWIDLRGRDNLYDDSWILNFLTVRLSSGVVDQISVDSSSDLLSDERGLETEAAWIKRPVFESSRIHEATSNAFDGMTRSFLPGFKLP